MVATTDHVPPVIAPPELEAGARLGDRYRLIERLGRGGGGAVWRVFDEKVGEELALKLIDASTDLERWRREVALARRISHPNVCRVYDLGEAGGKRWVTMEWIEGESLRALLRRGAIAEPERLMRQLVEAVAAIHATGVVHRDLKPENIVVDGRGRAVVVDFGLARQPAETEAPSSGGYGSGPPSPRSVTSHGTILGTPRYMAPEQAAGDVADARSDVYALGLVLHEIVAGSATPDATATTASDAGDVPERAPLATLPRPWGPLIERCTARAPADRLPDAVALHAALAPRRRRWLALAGAVVVPAVAVALVLAMRGDRASPAAPLAQRRLTATAATPANQPTSISISHDGKTLAYTAGNELLMRAIDGGGETPVPLPTTASGLPFLRSVEVAGFLGDDRAVLQILDRDHRWGLWSVGAGGPPRLLHQRDERMAIAVSPRGDLIAVATPRRGLLAVRLDGGPERLLLAPRAGVRFGGLAWSPGGTRIAFVRHAANTDEATLETVELARPEATRVLAREPLADPVDQMTAWPSEDRVVYVANERDGGAVLMGVVAGSPPGTIARWPTDHVAQLAFGGGRIVVLRGTVERGIRMGSIDRRGYYLNLVRGVPQHAPAGQLAGWTADGRLVHAADRELVVRPPHGLARPLATGGATPDAVIGDAVIYHRGPEIRRVATTGGDDRALLRLPRTAATGDVVRCAGDHAPPCVLEELDAGAVRYLRFDVATGTRGEELHRMPADRFVRSMALSPDGATLAVADGSHVVALVALAGGRVTRESLAPSTRVASVSWARDGASLLVSVLDGGDDRAGVIRLVPGGERHLLLHGNHLTYGRVHEVPVGNVVAIQTREPALDAWLVEGL